MPTKIFVVFGQSGEYSDHRNWPVKAFTSRERAETFEFECTKAATVFEAAEQQWSDQIRALYDSMTGRVPNVFMTPEYEAANKAYHAWREQALPIAVPGDSGFDPDGGSADYYTLEVEMESVDAT